MTRTEIEQAIANALRWFGEPDRGPLDTWEEIAAWYHAETGRLRPGKDNAAGAYSSERSEQDRLAHWRAWANAKGDKVRADLVAALAALRSEAHP